MKEVKMECDICHKKIGVDCSSYPVDTDYWDCIPENKHHGSMMYAVLQSPVLPMQICDDCFRKMLKIIGWKPPEKGDVLTSHVLDDGNTQFHFHRESWPDDE